MNVQTRRPRDNEARAGAMTAHDRSLLVEAGAGSGKTAVMAGRVALMLAAGIPPRSIAAVTFTELAASELVLRVREFAYELVAGRIPVELRVALPECLSETQKANLSAAIGAIDEITCTTIHGFCQRLIKPYPVEADIDPGAAVMDPAETGLIFDELVDDWLREALSDGEDGLLAELVLHNPEEAVALVRSILGPLRSRRALRVEAPAALTPLIEDFRSAAAAFGDFIRRSPIQASEIAAMSACFAEMAGALRGEPDEHAADLVRLLTAAAHQDLCKRDGGFRVLRAVGKWRDAAKSTGLSRTDADQSYAQVERHHEACCAAWTALKQAAAARVLEAVLDLARPVLDGFREHKRAAALLDFDDLIFAARDLLRDHEPVRRALSQRYAHVLVDEFQDTDPLQTEIVWRLCGEPPSGALSDWRAFRIRPGGLFMVGDPKQAIYRFRGADVATYVEARDLLRATDPDSILSISTNFRSCEPILGYVNRCFRGPLSAEKQPGFTPLDHFVPAPDDGPCVACLPVAVAGPDGKASAEQMRDAEADQVAELCARMIGSRMIPDRKTGPRPCRPGDIALLAPTGTDLWRYEQALEDRGVPVATQAGKGFYARQEIQDLIALTRALADPRDRLALGALLRGPVMGLTDEELLDITWALPRDSEEPDALPRLDLNVDPEHVAHERARHVIRSLQALRRRVNATTPYDLLCQAVDHLRVRPVLLQRHRGQAERALANVDLYLGMSRAYSVRGVRAFAESMRMAWEDGTRAVEGRPDAQEDSVALYTMHAAKGLEWPIVIPINTRTGVTGSDGVIVDRSTGCFYCPVLGVPPTGHEEAKQAEEAELERERVRIWYVAATRARELLVLPRLDCQPKGWIALVELGLDDLPALDVAALSPGADAGQTGLANEQTRDVFASEAAAIAARRRLVWRAPSRDEMAADLAFMSEEPDILLEDAAGETIDQPLRLIRGGRERGTILHKLLEEALTGETADAALSARAETLIGQTGRPVADDPAHGLCPAEIAASAARALALPEIAALRPRLVPELPVYGASETDGHEEAVTGIADAIAFAPDGTCEVVVDWKSDVDPAPRTLDHYLAQIGAYLELTGAGLGLIVLATTGQILRATRASATGRS